MKIKDLTFLADRYQLPKHTITRPVGIAQNFPIITRPSDLLEEATAGRFGYLTTMTHDFQGIINNRTPIPLQAPQRIVLFLSLINKSHNP